MNECSGTCFGRRVDAPPNTTQAVLNTMRGTWRIAPGHITPAEFAALKAIVLRRNETHSTQLRFCTHVGRRADGEQVFFSLVADNDRVLSRAGVDELRRDLAPFEQARRPKPTKE